MCNSRSVLLEWWSLHMRSSVNPMEQLQNIRFYLVESERDSTDHLRQPESFHVYVQNSNTFLQMYKMWCRNFTWSKTTVQCVHIMIWTPGGEADILIHCYGWEVRAKLFSGLKSFRGRPCASGNDVKNWWLSGRASHISSPVALCLWSFWGMSRVILLKLIFNHFLRGNTLCK